MSLFMENSVAKIGCGDPGDPIEFGALFDSNSANIGCLTRPLGSADPTLKLAISVWMRNGRGGGPFLTAGLGPASSQWVDAKSIGRGDGGTVNTASVENQFKDYAAWSHYLRVIDVSPGTPVAERVAFYIDGEQITPFENNMTDTGALALMDPAYYQAIGANINSAGSIIFSNNFVYLAEMAVFLGNVIDTISPTDFGRFNGDGDWVPIEFAGKGGGAAVYGARGFHLDFADPLNMGNDVSGNGNHWTVNGTIPQVIDAPADTFATANPTCPNPSGVTFSAGNLHLETAYNGDGLVPHGTLWGYGKFYYEADVTNNAGYGQGAIGVASVEVANSVVLWAGAGGDYAAYGQYDMAVDTFAGKGWVRDPSGSWVGGGDPALGTLPTFTFTGDEGPFSPAMGVSRTVGQPPAGIVDYRFGSTGFNRSVPAGFSGWSTTNLPCPVILDPSRYVQAPITIGGGAVTSLWDCLTTKTLVISKRRDTVADFRLNVVIGGVQYIVAVNVDGTEVTDADGLSFTTNGFALGSDTQYQGTCEHFARRASPLAGMDFVLVDNHVVGQVSTIAHNCGGAIHRAWDIPLDGGDIRQFHHKMPAGDYTLVNVAGRGNDPDWFSSTLNTVSIGGASVAGRHLLILERGVPQFSSFDVYDGNGVVDGPMIAADFAPLSLDIVRGDAVGPHTVRTLRNSEANPVFKELSYDSESAENQHSDTFYLLSNGAKCATNSAETGGQYTNANGGKYYTGMHAFCPGKFANAR